MMNLQNSYNQVVILFDEQGTPTFREDRETNFFLGVSVMYDLSAEDFIFDQSRILFGLSNTGALRNRKISNSRAVEISQLLPELPIQIVISILDLSDIEFQRVVNLYRDFGDIMRERYRNVRGRPIAQILHPQVLDDCIFNSICDYSERNQINSSFLVFIDDWSIPVNDIEIYLEDRSRSFQEKINSLHSEFNYGFEINVAEILLLNQDSYRKRFIGVIASVVSRAFLNNDNVRYSEVPLNNILSSEINQKNDITNKVKQLLIDVMDDSSRNPPL